jgi:hypothetical protein
VISEKVMDVMFKGLGVGMIVLFAYAFYSIATIPKQCLNGYVYEKSINDYWTKTKTECLPVSKE